MNQDADYKTVKIHANPPAKKTQKNKSLESLCKLIGKKNKGYQLTSEELLQCGVPPDKLDKVREAVNKADSAGYNIVLAAFGWFFAQVANLLDSIVKVLVIVVVFVCQLQMPYLNEQANNELALLVERAESNYEKQQRTLEEFTLVLQKNKIKGVKLEDEIPQLRRDKEEAKRWLKYKDRTLQSIFQEVRRQPLDSQVQLNDLKDIYVSALRNYHLGLPMTFQPYLNAALGSLIALIVYISVQSLLLLGLKGYARHQSLKSHLKKVL